MLNNQSVSVAAAFSGLNGALTYELLSGGGTLNASTGVYSPGSFTGAAKIKATDSSGNTLTCTINVTTYAALMLAETGLSYYYRLGENSGNVTSSATVDTAVSGGGTITYNQAGAIAGDTNTAVTLNGGYFTTTATLILQNQNFSMELWVKRTIAGAFHTTISHGSGTSGAGLHLALTNGNVLRLSFTGGGYDLDAPGTTETDTSAYHHYAFTYNAANSERIIYKDGVRMASVSGLAYIAAAASSIRIGAYAWDGGTPLAGSVDEVAIYNGTLLTPAQALRHYRAGTAQLFQ